MEFRWNLEPSYIAKIIAMKKENKAKTIKFLISFDPVKPAEVEGCKAVGVTLMTYNEVAEAGAND